MINNEKMRRIEKGLFSRKPEASLELNDLLKEISDTLDWIIDLSHRFIEGTGKERREEILVIQEILDKLSMLKRKPS